MPDIIFTKFYIELCAGGASIVAHISSARSSSRAHCHSLILCFGPAFAPAVLSCAASTFD